MFLSIGAKKMLEKMSGMLGMHVVETPNPSPSPPLKVDSSANCETVKDGAFVWYAKLATQRRI